MNKLLPAFLVFSCFYFLTADARLSNRSALEKTTLSDSRPNAIKIRDLKFFPYFSAGTPYNKTSISNLNALNEGSLEAYSVTKGADNKITRKSSFDQAIKKYTRVTGNNLNFNKAILAKTVLQYKKCSFAHIRQNRQVNADRLVESAYKKTLPIVFKATDNNRFFRWYDVQAGAP